jgi:hypothetical protein
MCRRSLRGPNGISAVLDRLDRELPEAHRFHLFGVKSDALTVLGNELRLASVDSCAWDDEARRANGGSCPPMATRLAHMRSWYARQSARLANPGHWTHQPRLFEAPETLDAVSAGDWLPEAMMSLVAEGEIDAADCHPATVAQWAALFDTAHPDEDDPAVAAAG